MKIHILGIVGTFMGGVATLACGPGMRVEGDDQAIHPPMSIRLATFGIAQEQGHAPGSIDDVRGQVVIGNARARDDSAMEPRGNSMWPGAPARAPSREAADAMADVDALLDAHAGDHVVFMSRGGFDGALRRFVERLS
ncbi:MAG: Mur ligase domain-containing protein [Pseudomonas sp.]